MRKHQDIRARLTRKLLQETFIALLAEKRFEVITVGEIAERAMVNRATFYRHYQDKYALGNSLFQEAIEQLACDLSSPLKPPSASEVEGVVTLLATSFAHIAEYSRLYRVMVRDAWFTAKMLDTLAQLLGNRLSLPPRNSQNAVEGMPEELAVASLANWFISIIRWWLENGMPYPPSRWRFGVPPLFPLDFFKPWAFLPLAKLMSSLRNSRCASRGCITSKKTKVGVCVARQ